MRELTGAHVSSSRSTIEHSNTPRELVRVWTTRHPDALFRHRSARVYILRKKTVPEIARNLQNDISILRCAHCFHRQHLDFLLKSRLYSALYVELLSSDLSLYSAGFDNIFEPVHVVVAGRFDVCKFVLPAEPAVRLRAKLVIRQKFNPLEILS